MNHAQPNFETLKTCFYNAFANSSNVDFAVLKEQTQAKILLPAFHVRKKAFLKDFNNWLNTIDIRQAGELVLILKEQKVKIPIWLKNFRYNIDYNKKGFLDLIKTV
jgi:hypothetical protein